MRDRYDLVVLGGGIAGSTLALVLSQIPCRVLVVERGRHPRFAIGESTIPSTTFGFRYLAKKYGVPELAQVTHYTGLKRNRLRGYPKRHFWFGLHQAGENLGGDRQLLFETFPLPNGPDVHMLRSDVDAFLVSRFSEYGVDYCDETELVAFERVGKGVRVTLANGKGRHRVEARLVVDATGHGSFFAKKFGLRVDPATLKTKSRAIFGHFRNLGQLDEILGENPFRFNREAGTVHHCFDGGWAWVIPFDDAVTSVGFMLHPDRFPLDPNRSPESEIKDLLDRFPTLARHLGGMLPIREMVRTGRVQFHSRKLVGDGFVLTPHAAAFVEPLFSSGLLLTQMFIMRFVPMVERCLRNDDFSSGFEGLELAFDREIELIDLIVSGMVQSFGDFEMFRQYWRIWVHATSLQFLGLIVGNPQDAEGLALAYGAAFPGWLETVQAMHREVFREEASCKERAIRMKALMDVLPHPFDIGRYEMHGAEPLQIHPDMDLYRQVRWAMSTVLTGLGSHRQGSMRRFLGHVMAEIGRRTRFSGNYLMSKLWRTEFHKYVDQLQTVSAKTTGSPRARGSKV